MCLAQKWVYSRLKVQADLASTVLGVWSLLALLDICFQVHAQTDEPQCLFVGLVTDDDLVLVLVQPTGIIGNIKERLEPSVPLPTIVNDGSIFIMMGLW